MTTMDTDTFYTRLNLEKLVCHALDEVQALDKRDEPSRDAWAVVMDYQERLAEMTDHTTLEGGVARCGAVYAAFRARRVDRGKALAERYMAEPGLDWQVRRSIEKVLVFDMPAPECDDRQQTKRLEEKNELEKTD